MTYIPDEKELAYYRSIGRRDLADEILKKRLITLPRIAVRENLTQNFGLTIPLKEGAVITARVDKDGNPLLIRPMLPQADRPYIVAHVHALHLVIVDTVTECHWMCFYPVLEACEILKEFHPHYIEVSKDLMTKTLLQKF